MFISRTQATLCLDSLLNSKWQRIRKLGKRSIPGKAVKMQSSLKESSVTAHGRAAPTEHTIPAWTSLGRQGEHQMLGWLQSSLLAASCTNTLLEAEAHTLILRNIYIHIYC